MNKYVGKYRVLCERDINGEPTDGKRTPTYIVGTGGYNDIKIYRYSKAELNIYRKKSNYNSFIKELEKADIKIIDSTKYDGEYDIRIKEKDLKKLDKIIKIKTAGKTFSPLSIKNHPRYKEIKEQNRINEEKNMTREEKIKRKELVDRLRRGKEEAKRRRGNN